MNYDNPELIDQLAASYVLGTLRGPARRRFIALAGESSAIQHAVWYWERKLLPLAESTSEVTPPASVWSAIEQRLGFIAAPAPGRQRARWHWPAISAVLSVAVFVLLVPFWKEPVLNQDSAAERLALIQDSEQQPLWVITVDEQSGRLSSIAVNAPAKDADRVFELWMLPEQGPPRSFGLLPVTDEGRGSTELSPALLALLSRAQGIAVSLEPTGGSPTGVPTGPVLYTAPVIGL